MYVCMYGWRDEGDGVDGVEWICIIGCDIVDERVGCCCCFFYSLIIGLFVWLFAFRERAFFFFFGLVYIGR